MTDGGHGDTRSEVEQLITVDVNEDGAGSVAAELDGFACQLDVSDLVPMVE